jgi:hypothetical protein
VRFGGLAKVAVSAAGVLTGVLPVSTVLPSYLIPEEPFSWGHPVGIANRQSVSSIGESAAPLAYALSPMINRKSFYKA